MIEDSSVEHDEVTTDRSRSTGAGILRWAVSGAIDRDEDDFAGIEESIGAAEGDCLNESAPAIPGASGFIARGRPGRGCCLRSGGSEECDGTGDGENCGCSDHDEGSQTDD
ncbi:hypothetical protein [Arthrobacter sp. Ld5]|uniref:hypothetical protein n=1 Tax=Arthrobacter sp. Ld5 TaxID=649152 RepID=UPI003EB6E1FD